MGTVNKSFHNMLSMNETLFRKRLFAELKHTGLTSGQPKILEFLSAHDGCVQKEIAAGCCIEPATVTSLLLRMEEARLVRRDMEHGDRRSFYVHLTELGKERAGKINGLIAELENTAFVGFTQEERRMVEESLLRLYENLRHAD